MSRLAQLRPRRFFLATWQQMDAEAEQERQQRRARQAGYDLRPLVVLCCGALFLSCMEYFGGADSFRELVAKLSSAAAGSLSADLAQHFRSSTFARLYPYLWWSFWRLLCYVLLPLLTLKLLRQKPSGYGLQTRGFLEHLWIYLLCYAVVLVCVVIVSFSPRFTSMYPFYHEARRSWFDLLAWELAYALQFFALEFFFRGYWLNACKTMMGSHAIFAMVVPYCMLHYGKPFPEVAGAIVAGVVLGTLAMKTGSIWSGALIHVSVALTMDIASLLQTNGLPQCWWP